MLDVRCPMSDVRFQISVGGGRNVLSDKVITRAREVANVSDGSGAVNVTPQFLGIAFAHENSAITAHHAFADFARSAIIITNLIGRAQSVDSGWKMQSRDLFLGIELNVTPRRWPFT